ncbi:MAG: DUF1624 domain-containing protein [Chloroflexi bacterium]|nr:DUF1624 domain-containing protein [Chloroflexota bacterium]
MGSSLTRRLWEVDSLRGIAIVMMVIFHTIFDLFSFGGFNINVYSGFWYYFARACATLFIFVMGISLTISAARAKERVNPGTSLFPKFMKRGLFIFGCGLLITLVTYILFPGNTIIFGILHLIGFSIILAYPFLSLGIWNLIIGLFCIAMGFVLQDQAFDFPWLLWLGLKPVQFYTLDYFPLFPWFGVALIGVFVGQSVYPGGVRRFKLPDLSGFPFTGALTFLGRHSLLIYLVHQPIIIAALTVLGIINPSVL